MFSAALFTIAKYGSNLSIHQQMNKKEAKKKSSEKKKRNFVISRKMDKLGGYYVQ